MCRTHLDSGVTESLCGGASILLPQIREDDLLATAHAPRNRLADRSRADHYDDVAHGVSPLLGGPTRYSSSETFSIHSTTFPSSASCTAMWVMCVVGVAPCQCLCPGGHQMTSPARISTIDSPSHCVQPQPAVTIRVCPSGWVCHAERAPGSNVTLAHETRAGRGAVFKGSMRTLPVKNSAEPFTDS